MGRKFLGYETTTAAARVVAILRDGTDYQELEALPEIELRAPAAAEAEIVLDQTPFYAEGGGQVGDHGVLRSATGDDPVHGYRHAASGAGADRPPRPLHGRLAVGDEVTAEVDAERRARTMRNHTGTHVLHRALRNTVGESARQAGSLVTPDYLRFDFPFDRALTADEKRSIEGEVRRVVRDNKTVTPRFMSMEEAIAAGADAFFDEKYGEKVRVIFVDGYSRELCGGTHCTVTGEIGGFVITGERSIGSGMRRIEALTGDAADAYFDARLALLDKVTEEAGARAPEALPDRLHELQERNRDLERRLRAGGSGTARPGELARSAQSVDGTRFLGYSAPFESMKELQSFARVAARRARRRRDRPGARVGRAAAVRDRERRPRGPRHQRRRAGQPGRAGDRGSWRRPAGDGPGAWNAARPAAQRPDRDPRGAPGRHCATAPTARPLRSSGLLAPIPPASRVASG